MLDAVDLADQARRRRNEVVHQDWLLRGPDAIRPFSDFARLDGAELNAYRIEWERESKDSADWLRVPHDSTEVVPAPTLDELQAVERALSSATDRVTELTFVVASAREGYPPGGWLAPTDCGAYRTPPKMAKTT